jgi:hypothetical protein
MTVTAQCKQFFPHRVLPLVSLSPLYMRLTFFSSFSTHRTFLKRKGGLFKKAHELSVLCSVDVAVFIFGNNKKLYEYSSADMPSLISRYQYVRLLYPVFFNLLSCLTTFLYAAWWS